MDEQHIPSSMQPVTRWVTWNYQPDLKRPAKPKKVPFQATTPPKYAKSNDATTWAPFDVACAAYRANHHAGIGFMLGDGWGGVDFDGCYDPETQTIADWAAPWIARLFSYAEVSPSGHGIKVIVRAEVTNPLKLSLGDHIGVEVYGAGRYFTITGQRLENSPPEPLAAQDAIDALLAHYRPSAAPARATMPPTAPDVAPPPQGDGWRQIRAGAVEVELRQWVRRKCDQAAEHIRCAPGNFHNARFAMARLLGGVIAAAPRHLSEHEALSVLYQARIPESHQGSEAKAILDGLRAGMAAPLGADDTPSVPTDEEPRQNARGFACCPRCDEPLRRSKYDYPGTGPGWFCPRCKHPMIWPREAVGGDLPAAHGADDDRDGDDGSTSPTPLLPSERIIAALVASGYAFRLNLLSDVIEVNGAALTDVIEAQIRTQMRDAGVRITGLQDSWTVAAAADSYHPIRDYLTGTPWDGVPRMPILAACLQSSDPPVVYADGSACPMPVVYLTRWLIGAVAKALEGEQNGMLVLTGGQGIGKSQFVRWLCSGLPAYFAESPINVADKDSHVRLMTRFIWEVSEFDATTRKADVAALKAFISTRTVTVRRAYARHDSVKPAVASLIGTLNDSTGFLTDETGSRRFMVVSLDHIDWAYQDIDINQIWAEATHRMQAGEPWRLLPEEARHQTAQNREYEAESLLTSWIGKYFLIDPARSDWRMTAADVADHLRERHDIRLSGSERAQAMEISRVMGHLAVPRVKSGGQRYYGGIATRADMGLDEE